MLGMRQRLAWLSTAPLMFAGLIAGHLLAYRLVYSDAHARADALARSGHAYLGYVPLALSVSLGVLLAGLALQAAAGFRGERRRPVASPLVVLLPPIAFVVQEFAERIAHTGQVPWTVVVQPAFLLGLAFQLPFALAALLIAWALDSAARAVGRVLGSQPLPAFQVFVPEPIGVAAVPRTAGLARGYGERAPPFARRP
jgi:CDP-diglyceride synthetase